MPTLTELLSAEQRTEDTWSFHVPRELHGAFGGAFGGIVASCTLIAARSAAPGRVPNALDCRFLRGLPAGGATATATVVNAGRTLTNVSVDLAAEDGRLCTRATTSLVDASVLHQFEKNVVSPSGWTDYDEADRWPPVAPIVGVLDPRLVWRDERSYATAVRTPWDFEGETAEAASVAADMAVGMPLGANVPSGVGTPNPDISLRFCGEVTEPVVVGVGRFDRASGGVAAIGIEVYSANTLVATGVSTALLLPPARS